MARGINANPRITPAPKPGRSMAKSANVPASKASAEKVSAGRPPVVSKEELRAQVEKLEKANVTLRAKSREANKAAKTAASRIAELEAEVAKLEKQVASQAASAKRSATRSLGRKSRDIDPGDAVPPGVAVQEPEPLDGEATTAKENLEEHLGRGEAGEREE